jgi:hypothetical protein
MNFSSSGVMIGIGGVFVAFAIGAAALDQC